MVFLKTKEMKKKEIEPGQSRWKKLGGGSLLISIGGKKRIIKPGEIFIAKEEEIPEGFRDRVKPLDTIVKTIPTGMTRGADSAPPPEAPPKPPTALVYSIQARSSGGYYDVVDKDGKPQNEKALRKDPAEALLKSLMG